MVIYDGDNDYDDIFLVALLNSALVMDEPRLEWLMEKEKI